MEVLNEIAVHFEGFVWSFFLYFVSFPLLAYYGSSGTRCSLFGVYSQEHGLTVHPIKDIYDLTITQERPGTTHCLNPLSVEVYLEYLSLFLP